MTGRVELKSVGILLPVPLLEELRDVRKSRLLNHLIRKLLADHVGKPALAHAPPEGAAGHRNRNSVEGESNA